MINPLQTEVDFPVFQFCKKNGIKCSWDFARSDGAQWTEIMNNDGNLEMQFSDNISVDVFKKLVQTFIKEYGSKEIENIGDSTMWWSIYSKKRFIKFVEEHKELFE
jgi:hypothetical protein